MPATVSDQMAEAVAMAVFELLPRLDWSTEHLRDHQQDALADVLAHAVERSRFHAQRLAGIDVAAVDPGDLAALPVMTKRDLMDAWDDVVTDRRLSLDGAQAHLDAIDRAGLSLLLDDYLVFQTGGSTGEPGVFAWHRAEMARWVASSIRWSLAVGFGPPRRTAWVGARSERHPSAAAGALTGADPDLNVPVDQPLADIVGRLNGLEADNLMVVASVLQPLVDAARAGDLVIAPERIGIFGDVVAPGAVEAAHEAFGVRPTEGYPTTDAGHLGQQSPAEAGIYLNEDLLIIECVDDHERPVAPGEPSDHLLVTSLHQRTLPLIRYRIDDRVIVDPEPGRHAAYRRLSAVEGRSDDAFHYPSATVHPHVFRSVLSRHLAVRDHQVTQTPTGADVALVVVAPVDTSAIREQILQGLGRAGLPDAEVEVTVVDRLRRTSLGKRRNYLPLEPPS